MTRSLILCAFLLAGCERVTMVTGEGLAPDVAVGETVTADVYDHHDGFETQGFSCDDEDDGVTVDDPSVVLVTKLGVEAVTVNGQDVSATQFAFTGLKLGSVVVTATCNGRSSSFRLHVR